MIITTKGKNGLKLMIDLSLYQGQEYVKLRDIAKREEISPDPQFPRLLPLHFFRGHVTIHPL